MNGRAFIDSNVLVYFVDRDEPEKRATARGLLEEGAPQLALSAQVLSEFYYVSTRRLSRPVPEPIAARLVDRFARLGTVAIDADLVRAGIEISRESQLAYWDGLIVAAAKAAGCERLLTEDLSDGSVLGGVRIENPFRGRP
ncbi:MAG: PIN domain-containing protein [Solirubrobacterales bacterium]